MTSGPTKRGRRATAIGGAVLLVLVIAGGYWFLTMGPGRQLLSPAGSTVAEFRGDGDTETSSFSVRAGWGIHWETSGSHFSFAIQGDRDFGVVIDTDEPGSGITSPTGAGTYHLVIDAQGPWSVRISQGD